MGWPAAFVLTLVILFRAAILGTCAYAVFWLDRSGWWFLLALCLTSATPDEPTEKTPSAKSESL